MALAAIAWLIAQGPVRGMWSFLALAPFGAAAAFNLPALGNATIGQLELTTAVVFVLVCLLPGAPDRLAGTLRVGQPGFLLLLLMLYCAISALFLPIIFAGETHVFSLSRAANADGIISLPLRPGTGNITQLFMMTLSMLAFVAFATLLRARPDAQAVLTALIVATVLNFILGWIDVITATAGLEALLDPIRTANYTMHVTDRMNGIKRMVGGFPEASTFGTFSLGLFAFWLHYWITSARSRVAALMLAGSAVVLLRSTSSGAYVALVIYLMSYGAFMLATRIRPSVNQRFAAIVMAGFVLGWMAVLGLFASYQLADPVSAFLDRTLFDKAGSDSGIERMSWNAQAFRNFTDTWLFGAGLGSVRASNWLLACLGSIGLIGTALYLAFLAAVFRMGLPDRGSEGAAVTASLRTACAALLISSLLTATLPNLGVFFFALAGMATGLARGAQLRDRVEFRVQAA